MDLVDLESILHAVISMANQINAEPVVHVGLTVAGGYYDETARSVSASSDMIRGSVRCSII